VFLLATGKLRKLQGRREFIHRQHFPYSISLISSSILLTSVDAFDAPDSRARTSDWETTILQLNLRNRAPFATTMDVGHESKGQA
jgi:hypothetical protein